MEYAHMNPEEAVRAHIDLGRPYTMPIHFHTFRLADEDFNDPLQQLEQARKKHSIDSERFRTLKVGEAWMVPIS